MSGSKWSKMFFRNTLVAHKSLINPYFSGVVVQQALICWRDLSKGIQDPGKSRFSGVFLFDLFYSSKNLRFTISAR